MTADHVQGDNREKRRRGLEMIAEVNCRDVATLVTGFEPAPPEQAPYLNGVLEHLYGDVWARPGLSRRDRRLLTIGVIASLGRADLAEVHFYGALKSGDITREEAGEALLHLACYAGWPNATAVSAGIAAAMERIDAER